MEITEQLTNPIQRTDDPYPLLYVGIRNVNTLKFIESLQGKQFQIKEVHKISNAFEVLSSFIPDIIILDSCDNELLCLEFCVFVKSLARHKNVLIFILSNRKDQALEIAAFNSGADDFILFPLKIKALLERIKARLKKKNNSITVIPDRNGALPLKIDRESYSVSLGNNFISLSKKEFELLHLMASNPERLFRREELLTLIWNKESAGKNRTLDVHISRLRQKIGNKFITSQKGIGYRFEK